MKKEDFKYDNPFGYADYMFVDNSEFSILIKQEIFDEDSIKYANKLIEKYKTGQVLAEILERGLREFYSSGFNYSDEDIKNKIGKPLIRIYIRKSLDSNESNYKYGGIVEFLESSLDEHIISIEFKENFVFLSEASLEG